MKKTLKRPVASFILVSNIIFFPLFLLTGITVMLGLPKIIFDFMLCLCSWSSTIAFAILFKRIFKGRSFVGFVKDQFRNRIKASVLTAAVMVPMSIFLVILSVSIAKSKGAGVIFTVSSFGALVYYFFKNLFAGPLGEELGWRGFALNELQKKHSSLSSALIMGFFWGLWHLPVWLTTGLTGMNLIKYIGGFMISIMCFSIVLTVLYRLNKNLVIPIVMHQLFNLLVGFISIDVTEIIIYYAIMYLLAAIVLIIVNPKKVLYWRNMTLIASEGGTA